MICSNCGWDNTPSNVFCEKCGTKLAVIPAPQPPVNQAFCANCGYPLSNPGPVCPSCGTPIPGREPVGGARELVGGMKDPVSGTLSSVKDQAPQEPVKTEIPVLGGPSFSLEPVNMAGEDNPAGRISYVGEKIVLNRANTEPGNPSITSKAQAEIVNKDGKWIISDGSSLKTTFIYISEPRELKDGDVILLGNRLFKFKA